MKTKRVDMQVKADEGRYQITASTPDIDRDGEIIEPTAFKNSLPGYLKTNPVILFGHDYSQPPVGRATAGKISDKSLTLDIEFAPTDFAQEVKALYDGGFMNTFSVGFIPRDGKFDDGAGAFTYTDAELLEVSCVSIPSNRAATMVREAMDQGFNVQNFAKALGVMTPEDIAAWNLANSPDAKGGELVPDELGKIMVEKLREFKEEINDSEDDTEVTEVAETREDVKSPYLGIADRYIGENHGQD